MLVPRGHQTAEPNVTSCDSKYPTLRMLDTTTFQWQTRFPLKDPTYQVPQAVIDVVGGGPNGGAKPVSTWGSTIGDNVPLFSKTIPRYDPQHPPLPSRAEKNEGAKANTTEGSAISLASPSGFPHVRGALAGVVIGGVIGGGMIGFALYFLFFRKRRRLTILKDQQRSSNKPELSPNSTRPAVATQWFRPRGFEGDDPSTMLPREMAGRNSRVEAPSTLHRTIEAPSRYTHDFFRELDS